MDGTFGRPFLNAALLWATAQLKSMVNNDHHALPA
jgi:hypothetical protein